MRPCGCIVRHTRRPNDRRYRRERAGARTRSGAGSLPSVQGGSGDPEPDRSTVVTQLLLLLLNIVLGATGWVLIWWLLHAIGVL